jgi:ketosteroid isomerase-like protein
MSNTIETLETAANALMKQGKMIESIDKYFADNCVFVEPDGARRSSRKDERAHLEKFFASLKSFDGATLHAQAVGNNVSMAEWTFKMTGGDGKAIVWNEVLVRTWRNDLIVSEKYYQQQG